MKFKSFKITWKYIYILFQSWPCKFAKTFHHISAGIANPGFPSVYKPQKPVSIFRTGLTTNMKYFCSDQLTTCLIVHPRKESLAFMSKSRQQSIRRSSKWRRTEAPEITMTQISYVQISCSKTVFCRKDILCL